MLLRFDHPRMAGRDNQPTTKTESPGRSASRCGTMVSWGKAHGFETGEPKAISRSMMPQR